MTTDTRPSTAEVWDWLAHVPDPEIPVISLTDLGIIRDVAWDDDTLVVTVTPTYSGCPATAIINLDIEKALARAGRREAEAQAPARAGLDHRLDQRRGPRQAPRLRHRPADRRHRRRRPAGRPRQPDDGRQPRRRLPALRLDPHRARSASSARPRARPATAATTASNPSTTSSASERTPETRNGTLPFPRCRRRPQARPATPSSSP